MQEIKDIAEQAPSKQPRGPGEIARRRRQHAKWQQRRRQQQRQQERETSADAAALRELLTECYPAAFCDPPKPLAIGLGKVLLQELAVEPAMLDTVLRWWTGRDLYLTAVAAGGPRYALDGSAAGGVSEAEQKQAERRLQQRYPLAIC